MEDAARVMWSGGGASAMLQRRWRAGSAEVLCSFSQSVRFKNAGGEQEWVMNLPPLCAAVIADERASTRLSDNYLDAIDTLVFQVTVLSRWYLCVGQAGYS